jgi:hypothetical protein
MLAIIVLTLTVTPCSDSQTCDSDAISMSFDHDHSEDTNDQCTPFCTCLCCGAHIASNDLIALQALIESPNFKYSHSYSFEYSFDYLNAIWHPPTLS